MPIVMRLDRVMAEKKISSTELAERIRKSKGMKQAELVAKMQLMGVDINLSSMSKLEGQVRAISDIELKAISQILKVTMEELVATERDRE